MDFSILGQALLSAGQNAANAASQNAANSANELIAMGQYGRQRADALADYKMINDYNSPAAQMERLKAAGLNPNLVYGNGNANMPASTVRASNMPSVQYKAPQFDLSGMVQSLFSQYDINLKKAQTDNLTAAKDVAVQEALLKTAQIANTVAGTSNIEARTKQVGVETGQGQFNLDMSNRLKETTVEAAEQNVKKLVADTQFTLSQNERNTLLNNQTLQKGVIEILQMRYDLETSQSQREKIQQEITNLKSSNALQELDVKLKQLGIQPHDPAYARFIAQLLQGDTLEKINNWLKSSQTLPTIMQGMKKVNPMLPW